jgi:hypothetical protein
MADETDGIEEAFDGQVRVLVTAAGQVGERLARAREDALRRGQAVSEREARELRSRIEAERAAARAELGNVYRAQWWDRATPEQIASTYQVARAWAREDPEALRAEQRMGDELRTRYGVDVDPAAADPAAVRVAVARAEQRLGQPERHPQAATGAAALGNADRAAVENDDAMRLLAAAAAADRMAERSREAAEHGPDLEDRAQARQVTEPVQAQAATQPRGAPPARGLEAQGVDPQTAARLRRVDAEQGMPATEATRVGLDKAPKARARRSPGVQVQRTGPDR